MPRPVHPSPSPSPLRPPPIALTIAGHDPSSGAGITADLQTFAAHGLFGSSAVTALTVQSTLGVTESQPVTPDMLARVLAHLCADMPPAGVKIGLLGSAGIAATVADFLASLQGSPFGARLPIVFDPVFRASSGAVLLPTAALEVLHTRLLPAVDWITPNWGELAEIAGRPVGSLDAAEAAMHLLGQRHPHLHIAATGGERDPPTDLLRLPSGELHRFAGERVATTSTHGTGCAFSSALLSRLILGDTPVEAVASAKYFVAGALRHAPGLGHGRGPLHLLWRLQRS